MEMNRFVEEHIRRLDRVSTGTQNFRRLTSSQMAMGDRIYLVIYLSGHRCHAVQCFQVGFPGAAVLTELVVQKGALNH